MAHLWSSWTIAIARRGRPGGSLLGLRDAAHRQLDRAIGNDRSDRGECSDDPARTERGHGSRRCEHADEPCDEHGEPLRVSLTLDGVPVQIGIWQVNVGVIPLYLLDTNVSPNGPEDRDITKQLYGGDFDGPVAVEEHPWHVAQTIVVCLW